jgi:hypothetical protein
MFREYLSPLTSTKNPGVEQGWTGVPYYNRVLALLDRLLRRGRFEFIWRKSYTIGMMILVNGPKIA